MRRFNARELRVVEPEPEVVRNLPRNPIYIVLDNVLDTYNIGSLFRLADAVAAEQILLCGKTETPPNPKIKKASINTTGWVNWVYFHSPKSAIKNLKLKIKNLMIVVIEQHPKSISLKDFKPKFPIAIVVGNETYGVSKEVLEMADTIVELPMFGVNKSLNVMVAAGIVLYKLVEFL